MSTRRVLVVADPAVERVCDLLPAIDWQIHPATDVCQAAQMLAAETFHVGLVIVVQPDSLICSRLDRFLCHHPSVEWVGGFGSQALQFQECRDLIIDRMFDHVTLPIEAERLAATLGHAYGRALLRSDAQRDPVAQGDAEIIGRTAAIMRLLRQIDRVGQADAPALIGGESGSGKELVAKAIHRASRRAGGPFVVVNCGAIPAPLIQSELFGHEKGAFTGADRQRMGLIEAANGGTLFLDEIGDLPLDMQTNLLRFLQEGTIDRVGSTKAIHVDARVIAATHVEIDVAVAAGTFRKDLYYRLNVLPLTVPPLRERKDDVPLLAEHFFQKFGSDRGRQLKGFSRRAITAMAGHDWPGNVRELVNRVRRALVMAEGRLITPADLGLASYDDAPILVPLDEARMDAERTAISRCLHSVGQNISQAARQLRISRMTLYRLMAKHGISIPS